MSNHFHRLPYYVFATMLVGFAIAQLVIQ